MDFTQILIALIGALFGGGLAVIFTLKWVAKKAQFEAKNTEVDYAKNMLDTQVNYIIDPLKGEIKLLRRDLRGLQRAIEQISNCEFKDQCPVHQELKKEEETNEKD